MIAVKRIGIDPDIVKSGIAVVLNDVILRMDSVPFAEIANYVKAQGNPDEVVILLENPEAIRPLFGKKLNLTRRARDKACMDVGMCKGAARLIGEVLTHAGYTVVKVSPLKGIVKKAKDDKAFFNRLTKWESNSNQDKRDAALIALYGGR